MDRRVLKEAIITLAIALLTTFGAVSAIADEYFSDDDMKNIAYVVSAFEQSNSTLPLLIEKAEKAGQGVAVEVEVEEGVDGRYLEISLFRENEIIQVKCSLITGEILSVGQPEFLPSIISKICDQYKTIKYNKISMTKAVRLAEINTSGTAYRAEVENMDGWLCYQVHLFTPTKTMVAIIDPNTGRIVSHRNLDRSRHSGNDQ